MHRNSWAGIALSRPADADTLQKQDTKAKEELTAAWVPRHAHRAPRTDQEIYLLHAFKEFSVQALPDQ